MGTRTLCCEGHFLTLVDFCSEVKLHGADRRAHQSRCEPFSPEAGPSGAPARAPQRATSDTFPSTLKERPTIDVQITELPLRNQKMDGLIFLRGLVVPCPVQSSSCYRRVVNSGPVLVHTLAVNSQSVRGLFVQASAERVPEEAGALEHHHSC